jgi:DNA-binding GntR family transcriptional regulator
MTSTLYAVPMAREEQPKYRLIADDLRARMESGEYPPDSRLPSKAAMEKHYRVALATVNHALSVLHEEGRAETIHGIGTFARKPREAEPSPEFRELAAQVRLLTERMDAAEAWMAAQEDRGQ